jgi:ribosomal protein L37E
MREEKQKIRKEKLKKIEENFTTNYYLPHCKKCGDVSFEAHDNPGKVCAKCELKEKREKRKEKIEEIIKNNQTDETRRSI